MLAAGVPAATGQLPEGLVRRVAELQVPMARVVIGGLLTSTLITLVFIPVVYASLEELAERVAGRRKGIVAEPLQPAEGD